MKKQFVVILTALFALGTATVSAVDGQEADGLRKSDDWHKRNGTYVSRSLCPIWNRAA